ncbi:MAG: hypothetical protein V4721_02385 [Bacteroidota bacterium]
MSNYFDIKRFSLLLNKHTSEHISSYFIAVLALFGLLFSVVLFFTPLNNGKISVYFQRDIFLCFLWLAGSVFASTVFANLGNNKKASVELMLPSSHFEKFLVSWIYSYLLFQLVYVGVFYLVMFIASSLAYARGNPFEIFSLGTDLKVTTWIFLFYMVFHAVAFAGSIYFRKLHFIKTVLVFFCFFVVLILLNEPLIELILNRDVTARIPFGKAGIVETNQMFPLDIRKTQKLYLIVVPIITAVLLWTASYFRLKEKEI